MVKKIGFIDSSIDEWHANHLPEWIKAAERGSEFEVAMAWEEAPLQGRPLQVWCNDFGVTPATSQEELIEKCDCICVLAPANPEKHYELSKLALQSGKPTFIDKPFALDISDAKRMADLAEKYNTPFFSTSSLRFCDALQTALREKFQDGAPTAALAVGAGKTFDEYGIHLLEMIVCALGCGAIRVMGIGNDSEHQLLIDYKDGRSAVAALYPAAPYALTLSRNRTIAVMNDMQNFFIGFTKALLDFFTTGVPPVPFAETLEIASLRAAGVEALKNPGTWINL